MNRKLIKEKLTFEKHNNIIGKYYIPPIYYYKHSMPRIIHQSWKTYNLPDNFAKWSKTIKKNHPKWRYILWDDKDNRNFIKNKDPKFLKAYDSYNMNIKRADAARYYYMYYYGGLYADLDFECLKSVNNLIRNKKVILGKMGDGKCSHCIPNAIMFSVPKHPFWLHVINIMKKRVNAGFPEYDTGPELLKEAYDSYKNKKDITLLDSKYFYPINWLTEKGQWYRNNIPKNPKKEFPDSYFVTYWSHSW